MRCLASVRVRFAALKLLGSISLENGGSFSLLWLSGGCHFRVWMYLIQPMVRHWAPQKEEEHVKEALMLKIEREREREKESTVLVVSGI